jgi:hypothetical protein
MPVAPDHARLPSSAADDIAYVRAHFEPIEAEACELVERGLLPQATYVLPDGTPMVPADHAQLLDDAGGNPADIEAHFIERFIAAGGERSQAREELRAWLSGEYGACLWQTSPEAIIAKTGLTTAIRALLSRPAPADPSWRAIVRSATDALDSLERPFAKYDRERFGSPTSRDRLITETRRLFPDAFQDQHAAGAT